MLRSLVGSEMCIRDSYRANEPAELVKRQQEIWNPYIDRWKSLLGVSLRTTAGIIAVTQSDEAIGAARAYLEAMTSEQLIGVKAATEISGSAVLVFALANDPDQRDDIFAASRLDELFQEERWGVDNEAKEREQNMRRDFMAAARFLSFTS